VVQESDWLTRGPHQQHHLMERLSLRGHKVHVVDFEIEWRKKNRGLFCSKRKVFEGVSKVCKGSRIDVFRPRILRLPLFDYVSIISTHAVEVHRQMQQFKPNVVVGFGILNTFIALKMAKRRKIAFMYYLIDTLHTLIPFKKLRFLGKALESSILRQSDVVCVINERLKDYSVEMGAQPEKIRIIKAGIDKVRFNPMVDGYAVRKKLGISMDDVVLFFMGWLYSFSGLREVAIELAKIKDTYPNIKLLIVGEGELYHVLQQVKKASGLEQLILVGWQPYEKIHEFIAASDICLLPAHNNEVMRNIVPIKMYEYMACGKPVVSTKLPGIIREFDHNNGVLYVDHPSEVLRKVIELVGIGSIEAHGIAARKFVEKHSWEKITKEFECILKEISRC